MNICFQKSNQRAFGTWPLKGDDLRNALGAALETGYRAIDTAQMYGNETEVGETIAASGIARHDLCVTTKVTPENFATEKFIPSVERSLAALGLDHVDILLLHWPPMGGDVVPPVRLLAEAPRARPRPKHRRLQLHRENAAGRQSRRGRPHRHQPGRVPPADRPA